MKSIFKQNKLLLSITVLLSIITSIAYVYIALILQKVTDTALSKDLSAFKIVLIQAVLYLLILGLINYIYAICSKRLVCNIIRQLRNNVFQGILRRNVQDFTSVNSADYLSAFTNDIKLVEDNYILSLLMLLQYIVMFVGTVIMLFIISPLIAVCLIGFLILMLVVPSFFGKALQKRQDRLSKTLSLFTVKIKDILSGYEVIKSYNMGSHIKSEFKKQNNETISARFHSDRLIAASESLSEILAYLTLFSGIFIGAYLIILGNISAGTLLALIQLSSSFVNPLMIIMQCVPKIQGAKPILVRLEELSSYKDTSFTGTEIPSFDNTIKADRLHFSYDENHSVLNNAELAIEKNKKYAIVGQSGCGKSTLVKLLSGKYYNYEGEILYDEKDIRNLDIDQLTNMISTIHQNIYMFDDTIKENICLYESFSNEELEKALTISGVQQFLENTPNGIQSLVGENGSNLSGGQRQRIAVARALIQKKPILILDEGTSAIDMQTAYDIESRLLKLENLTLITITHNMSRDILSMYDAIIYMENGTIAETGTLDELISNNGAFYRFFNLQK